MEPRGGIANIVKKKRKNSVMNYECHDGVTYTIESGDTLYEVSRKYQVPLSLLLRSNPYIDVFNMQPGDTICVPVKKPMPPERPIPPERPMKPMPPMNPREQRETSAENVSNQTREDENLSSQETERMEWKRYVVKPGDTMKTLTDEENLMAFIEENGLDGIYLLPGIAYQVKK